MRRSKAQRWADTERVLLPGLLKRVRWLFLRRPGCLVERLGMRQRVGDITGLSVCHDLLRKLSIAMWLVVAVAMLRVEGAQPHVSMKSVSAQLYATMLSEPSVAPHLISSLCRSQPCEAPGIVPSPSLYHTHYRPVPTSKFTTFVSGISLQHPKLAIFIAIQIN